MQLVNNMLNEYVMLFWLKSRIALLFFNILQRYDCILQLAKINCSTQIIKPQTSFKLIENENTQSLKSNGIVWFRIVLKRLESKSGIKTNLN
jgi:hypothetical protein